MRRVHSVLWKLIGLGLLAPAAAAAQWDVTPKAALPSVPYWWTVSEQQSIDLIPLLWTNDVDGGSGGCCVIGAAGRARLGRTTVWLGLGFGTEPDGGTPAAIEAAAEIGWATLAYRDLHGRTGVSVFFPIHVSSEGGRREMTRLSAGLSAVSLDDERYVDPVPLFSCSDGAPSVPCTEVPAPYPWSPEQDVGLALEGTWGRGERFAPRVTGSAVWGLKVASGDYGYFRGELDARQRGALGRFDWLARLGGGWAWGSAPLQRRFLLSGADPITRWLNPYIDVSGAVLEKASYFVPGGPNLRAYVEIQPLVDGYLSAGGAIGRGGATRSGFWGRVDAFLETAWTPGIPDRLGPEQLGPDGSFLFDWRELPSGEGSEQGEFRSRVLEVSELWADAGFTFTGGHRNIALAISTPLWASNAAFADGPAGDGAKTAFAVRWTLSIFFFPYGRPGE